MSRLLKRIPPRVLGAAALVLTAGLIAITFSGVYRKPFSGSSTKVVADFDRASQLYAGDEVRLDGRIDGKVSSVQSAPGLQGARVTIALDSGAGPIYSDARAQLRFKTLLGGSFYVAVDRGNPAAGRLGSAVIPRSRTSVQVEIEDVTDIFRGAAMQGFKTLSNETGKALADPASVAGDIGTASAIAPDATPALRALRGIAAGYDLPALVQDTARTVNALDTPTNQLHELVSGAAATVATTGARSAEISGTIAALPSVTLNLSSTLSRLDTTLNIGDSLIGRLIPAAPAVAPTLARLRPALDDTNGLLQSARPLLQALPPLLGELQSTSTTGVPLINQLSPALQQFDDIILPYLGAPAPDTGYSTTVMIGATATGFGGGSSGQLDENGRLIRFPASIGASSVYLPCTSRLIGTDPSALLKCDSLNTALQNYLSYLPKLSPSAGAGR